MDEETPRRMAQSLLADLDRLAEPDQAATELRNQLAELLDRGSRGEQVAVPICRLIGTHQAPRPAPPPLGELPVQAGPGTSPPPPGDLDLPLSPRYVCPVDGYEFYRHDLARPVPPCPHDGTTLVAGDDT